MSNKRVQIILRMTNNEREAVKKMAKKENKSMNQFILDAIFNDSNDASKKDINDDISRDIKVIEILNQQLSKKDVQIEELQRLLDQQQQLTLQANRQIKQLQLENHSLLKNEEDTTKSDKSFWSRFFN